ncbi:HAD family hydrolase [Dickeya oryzae]|uniref:HAD family hydrolase n=1 Tax=Dickeya oryzae TaxID=1240404 RepID=UPI001297A004|nr:HAD family hydrolase [Dickeya oryzae]
MVKIVIFDLDDTLVSHKAGADSALKAVTDWIVKYQYAKANSDFNAFREFFYKKNQYLWEDFVLGSIEMKMIFDKRFEYIYDWFDIKSLKHKKLIEGIYWDDYVSNCSLTRDWVPLLSELSEKLPLIICSNGMDKVQIKKLENKNIKKYFKSLYFGKSYPECKPNKIFFIRY